MKNTGSLKAGQRLSQLFPSREVRDVVIKSGMEHGAAESYDKLAELLDSMPGSGTEKLARQA